MNCSRVLYTHAIQVAEQQGKYLARHLNALVKEGKEDCEAFQYHQMGMLATVEG